MTDSTVQPADLAVLARQAMLQRGLEPDFPAPAIEQAQRLPGPARDSAIADQSNLLWCSIDNEDSRDLDQLTVCERVSGGSVRIHVAVADVDALVAKGTPVDEHARRNTTSVYTPVRIFPMLPERLSTDLTSLNAQEDRLAIVISYVVGTDGAVSEGEVKRALVRNRAKLDYNSRGRMARRGVDSSGGSGHARPSGSDPIQYEVAQRLKLRRHQEGALDLETIEPRATVVNGRVVDLRRETKNAARSLIEDFMIAANGVTARYLEVEGVAVAAARRTFARALGPLAGPGGGTGRPLPSDPDPKASS